MQKTAVVLFNLGGPDSLKSVRPFLFNLFNDRAIIGVPQPLRFLLASLISSRRAAKARGIYQHMGGKSPILEQSRAQAEALEKRLNRNSEKTQTEYKTFVCMRYWHPMSDAVVRNVKSWAPDRVVLLPLYPQFSTTTTASSFAQWRQMARKAGLNASTSYICCYPSNLNFIAAHVKHMKEAYWKAAEDAQPRVLFSAHGLPEKVIKKGDPYQWQIEQTVASIVQVLAIDALDYRICYQSKVGPLKWIGPSTEEEIIQAGKDQVPVLVVPISFVSEHSETLVELDIDYRNLAQASGVPNYFRVSALGTEPLFLETLAEFCQKDMQDGQICSSGEQRVCPPEFTACPCAA